MLKGIDGIPSVNIIGKRWTEGVSYCSNTGEREEFSAGDTSTDCFHFCLDFGVQQGCSFEKCTHCSPSHCTKKSIPHGRIVVKVGIMGHMGGLKGLWKVG